MDDEEVDYKSKVKIEQRNVYENEKIVEKNQKRKVDSPSDDGLYLLVY